MNDSELVGFITFEKSNTDYFDTNYTEHGDVIEIYVIEEYRGKGVGKLLMQSVEDYFKKQGISVLTVQCSTLNNSGLAFYKGIGMKDKQVLFYKKIQ